MPLFEKLPVSVRAEQFFQSKKPWPDGVCLDRFIPIHYVETQGGRIEIESGDWVVTGIEGEVYPVKDSVFNKTYKLVKDGERNR